MSISRWKAARSYDNGETITSDGFSDAEIAMIMGIFDGVSDFTAITFQRTTNQATADIQLAGIIWEAVCWASCIRRTSPLPLGWVS